MVLFCFSCAVVRVTIILTSQVYGYNTVDKALKEFYSSQGQNLHNKHLPNDWVVCYKHPKDLGKQVSEQFIMKQQ